MHPSKSNISGVFALVICLLALFAFAYPQKPKKAEKMQDPSQKPIKARAENNDALERWLTEDVPYIITPAERDAFRKLKTNDEREKFIETFWRNRDPDPETEENEYREAYYARIAYANENFSSGIPGWKTDRGRIYITWGKPDSVEAHPSGGSYERPPWEGKGTITTVPFETWSYRHLDGVGDGVEIEFVDRSGSGEYKFARDFDEKNAFAGVTGPASTRGADDGRYLREQDTPLSRNLRAAALETPPRVKFTDLDPIARGDSGSADLFPLEFDLRVDFFKQSDDRVIAAFTVQADNGELQFKDSGGLQTAVLNIFGRITAVAGNRSGIFEDSVTANASVNELPGLKQRKSVYQKAIALAPGTYKVSVVVRDVNTGNKGLRALGFTVPRYDDKKLSTSSLVLTSALRSSTERDIGQAFVIGDAKVIPNLSSTYKKGQQVGVYMQIYNASIDQTTLRPAADVEYVLLKNGMEVLRQKEDWSGLSDAGQRLTLARILPTEQLAPGEYEIKVVTKDHVGGQIVENKGTFTVTP